MIPVHPGPAPSRELRDHEAQRSSAIPRTAGAAGRFVTG